VPSGIRLMGVSESLSFLGGIRNTGVNTSHTPIGVVARSHSHLIPHTIPLISG
jgi:hypothetical protein